MRRRLANVLLLVGLLMTGSMALVAYFGRTMLDQDAFSARISAALQRPAVAAYVSQRIADGVVSTDRDLTGVKPLIATFAETVVRSAPFQALVQRAAREAHGALTSEGAENVMLSVPDVGVLLRGAIASVNPEVAKKIPADVRAVIDTRLRGVIATRLVAILQRAARVRLVVRFGMVAGLLLVAFSVAVTSDRRQGLLNTGIGLLAVAAVLALVVPLGRVPLVAAIADPPLRAAIGEVWNAFTVGLYPWATGIGVLGGLVVASAAALVERAQLREAVLGALAELGGPRPTRGRELARLAVVLVLGGFAVAAPLTTLKTLTVIAGILLLMAAVVGFVAQVAPHGLGAEGAAPVRFNPALSIALAVVIVMAAGLGGLGVGLRFHPAAATVEAGGLLECNGAAALCDRRFDQVTFPGAHNAMGSADDPHWMFPNQDASVAKLLRLGVRAFMLDVWNGRPVGGTIKTSFESDDQRRKFEQVIGPEAFAAAMRIRDRLVGEGGPVGLYMCHGFCELGALPFDTALAGIRDFLQENPAEVVLVIIEDYVSAADIAAAFQRAGLIGLVYRGPTRGPYPTLRQAIASNQRLFLMGEHNVDAIPWYHLAFAAMQETPYTFHQPEDFSCGPNRGEKDNPLFLMNHWIETTPAPRPSNAEVVNAEAFLLARARECGKIRGKNPNVIAVDFAATGDVVRAAEVLNGVAGQPAR